MAEVKPFIPVKLICGIIASQEEIFEKSEEQLTFLYGPLDQKSSLFKFDFTDYYEKQMGRNLKRRFLSFSNLISPEKLGHIKIRTNKLEESIQKDAKAASRAVNLDPGYLTPSALVMATTKDFAHRIPLQNGIYAHLELLFSKKETRTLNWTYPDYKTESYQRFFIEIRKIYLEQLSALIAAR